MSAWPKDAYCAFNITKLIFSPMCSLVKAKEKVSVFASKNFWSFALGPKELPPGGVQSGWMMLKKAPKNVYYRRAGFTYVLLHLRRFSKLFCLCYASGISSKLNQLSFVHFFWKLWPRESRAHHSLEREDYKWPVINDFKTACAGKKCHNSCSDKSYSSQTCLDVIKSMIRACNCSI